MNPKKWRACGQAVPRFGNEFYNNIAWRKDTYFGILLKSSLACNTSYTKQLKFGEFYFIIYHIFNQVFFFLVFSIRHSKYKCWKNVCFPLPPFCWICLIVQIFYLIFLHYWNASSYIYFTVFILNCFVMPQHKQYIPQ